MPGVLEKTTTPCNETLKIEIMIFLGILYYWPY